MDLNAHISAVSGFYDLSEADKIRVQISWGNGNLIGSEKLAAVDRSSAIAGG